MSDVINQTSFSVRKWKTRTEKLLNLDLREMVCRTWISLVNQWSGETLFSVLGRELHQLVDVRNKYTSVRG